MYATYNILKIQVLKHTTGILLGWKIHSLKMLACAVLFARSQLPPADDVPRLWPQPTSVTPITPTSAQPHLRLVAGSFRITCNSSQHQAMLWNIDYYQKAIFARKGSAPNKTDETIADLNELQVIINTSDLDGLPYLGMDESYSLNLVSPKSQLRANSVWGAIRGLETFSQTLQMNGEYLIRVMFSKRSNATVFY